MVDRPTPLESDQVRCTIEELDSDRVELDGLKNDFDTFLTYRSRFDRAQMIYLAGRIMHRVTNFFSPFLCDIGVMMHHESLSDEDYAALLAKLQQATEIQQGVPNEDTRDTRDTKPSQDDPQ